MTVEDARWVAECLGGAVTLLRPNDISVLADILFRRQFDDGEVLVEAGVKPDTVWILRGGIAELSVGVGRRRVVIGLLHPGAVEGDIAVLRRTAVAYTVSALGACACLGISTPVFETLLATQPNIARRWLAAVADRAAESRDRLIATLSGPLNEQVARVLLDEAVDGSVRLAQRTLAEMLGVARPSLNKVLKDLEREGIITINYGGVDILDADRLAYVPEESDQ